MDIVLCSTDTGTGVKVVVKCGDINTYYMLYDIFYSSNDIYAVLFLHYGHIDLLYICLATQFLFNIILHHHYHHCLFIHHPYMCQPLLGLLVSPEIYCPVRYICVVVIVEQVCIVSIIL